MSIENCSPREVVEMYAKDYGIHFYGNYRPVICKDSASFKRIVKDFDKRMAMDVDTYTYNPASNGVPAWMTLVNLNKIVSQLLIKRAYMEIGEAYQQGDFETNTMQWGSVGLVNSVEPYADFSASPISDINVTFPSRDVVRAQTMIQYGELEQATLSAAKIDGISQKQYSAAMAMAISQNKLFFFGNLSAAGAFLTRTFGILNDPQLNAATPATNGGSGSPLWSVKAQSASGAQDIANDVIVTAYGVLQSQMGGNVAIDDEFLLCVSTTASAYLNATNIYGLNAKEIIEQTMPNVRFVFAPEYATIGSFQLIAAKSMGENLVKDLFTYKARGHGIWRSGPTAFSEKWSFGSAGAGILQYAPIATISGIQ